MQTTSDLRKTIFEKAYPNAPYLNPNLYHSVENHDFRGCWKVGNVKFDEEEIYEHVLVYIIFEIQEKIRWSAISVNWSIEENVENCRMENFTICKKVIKYLDNIFPELNPAKFKVYLKVVEMFIHNVNGIEHFAYENDGEGYGYPFDLTNDPKLGIYNYYNGKIIKRDEDDLKNRALFDAWFNVPKGYTYDGISLINIKTGYRCVDLNVLKSFDHFPDRAYAEEWITFIGDDDVNYVDEANHGHRGNAYDYDHFRTAMMRFKTDATYRLRHNTKKAKALELEIYNIMKSQRDKKNMNKRIDKPKIGYYNISSHFKNCEEDSDDDDLIHIRKEAIRNLNKFTDF